MGARDNVRYIVMQDFHLIQCHLKERIISIKKLDKFD